MLFSGKPKQMTTNLVPIDSSFDLDFTLHTCSSFVFTRMNDGSSSTNRWISNDQWRKGCCRSVRKSGMWTQLVFYGATVKWQNNKLAWLWLLSLLIRMKGTDSPEVRFTNPLFSVALPTIQISLHFSHHLRLVLPFHWLTRIPRNGKWKPRSNDHLETSAIIRMKIQACLSGSSPARNISLKISLFSFSP